MYALVIVLEHVDVENQLHVRCLFVRIYPKKQYLEVAGAYSQPSHTPEQKQHTPAQRATLIQFEEAKLPSILRSNKTGRVRYLGSYLQQTALALRNLRSGYRLTFLDVDSPRILAPDKSPAFRKATLIS